MWIFHGKIFSTISCGKSWWIWMWRKINDVELYRKQRVSGSSSDTRFRKARCPHLWWMVDISVTMRGEIYNARTFCDLWKISFLLLNGEACRPLLLSCTHWTTYVDERKLQNRCNLSLNAVHFVVCYYLWRHCY